MSFLSWLQILRSALAPRRGAHRAATPRLNLEVLEDRNLLSFSPVVNYAVGAYPQAVVAGHFNNDAVLDLAVVNSGSNNVSVLLGNPDGTFALSGNYDTDAGPFSVAVGDFNDDGNLDLATANAAGVSVRPGNGDGTFGTASNINLDSAPTSLAVGDFNDDGKMDLGVTSNVYTPGYYGPGYWAGGYYGYYYYPGPWNPGYHEGRANVLIGDGTGSFSAPNTTDLGYGYHSSAAVADFNSDGIDDFATVNANNWTVSVLLGDASGYLQGPSEFYGGTYPYVVAAADVDGDLDADLVTMNGYDVSVLLGDGAGNFGGADNFAAGEYPSSIVLGDFTHDGNIDIATTSGNSNSVTVLRGLGDGTFAPVGTAAAGTNPGALAAGDFNGDGWLDLATANYGGDNISVLLNTQDWRSFQVAGYPSSIVVGETHTITITALDNLGNVLAGYTGTVHFSSSDASAGLPDDFTFVAGDHGAKSFNVTLNALGTQSISVNDTATPTIQGGQIGIIVSPPPPATLSIDDVTVTESDSGTVAALFTVTRGGNLDNTVTVNYSTANGGALSGSDYGAGGATLTFAPGVTTQTVTILVNGDLMDEYDQAFHVNLSGVSAGNSILDGQGQGMILDNDPPPTITITAKVSAKEGNHNTTTLFHFIVTLSAASEKEVRVNFATANGTANTLDNDYVAKSGTLIFAPGQTSKTIAVVVKGDKKKESNETFFVNLTSPTNATILSAQGIGEILNDDGGKPQP